MHLCCTPLSKTIRCILFYTYDRKIASAENTPLRGSKSPTRLEIRPIFLTRICISTNLHIYKKFTLKYKDHTLQDQKIIPCSCLEIFCISKYFLTQIHPHESNLQNIVCENNIEIFFLIHSSITSIRAKTT